MYTRVVRSMIIFYIYAYIYVEETFTYILYKEAKQHVISSCCCCIICCCIFHSLYVSCAVYDSIRILYYYYFVNFVRCLLACLHECCSTSYWTSTTGWQAVSNYTTVSRHMNGLILCVSLHIYVCYRYIYEWLMCSYESFV